MQATSTLLTGADLLTPRWTPESLRGFFHDRHVRRARSWEKASKSNLDQAVRNYKIGELLVGPLVWVGDRDAHINAVSLEALSGFGQQLEAILQLGDSREPDARWVGPATEMISVYFRAGAGSEQMAALIDSLKLAPGQLAQALLTTLRDYRGDSRLARGYERAWRAFTMGNARRFTELLTRLGRSDLSETMKIDLGAAKLAAFDYAQAKGYDFPDRIL